MKSDSALYLKDGTLWDDAKSDVFVDNLFERMAIADQQGKLVVGSRTKLTRDQQIRLQKARGTYSVSIDHLPRNLREDLLAA